jgi:nucleoside-specific outer membrane channel protein Tsx
MNGSKAPAMLLITLAATTALAQATARADQPADGVDSSPPLPPAGQVAATPPAPTPETALKKMAEWSMFNIQYLYGFNWQLGVKRKDIITFEHADGWKYGDNYLFVDVAHLADRGDKTGIYGEWQPRFSLSKITGYSVAAGPMADVLQSNRIAFGDGFFAHLNGLAVDLKIPRFSFFHQHLFLRNDLHHDGVTWQVTSEWSVPIEISPARFVLGGFVHFIGPEGGSKFNIISQPQLLLDLGNFNGYTDQMFIGVEVDLRYNEFGIDGQNEVVAQAMAEWKI